MKTFLVLFAVAAAFTLAPTTASAINVASGKMYKYDLAIPGQGTVTHYLDDNGAGLHAVHSSGMGVYDTGDLTDGVFQLAAPGGVKQPVMAMHTGGAPAVNITFDLEGLFTIDEVLLGTDITAAFNNNAPDDVTIRFSTDGTTFDAGTFFDLEGDYGPLSDGRHDLSMQFGAVNATHVMLSFDGGSMAEPSGSDPNEKYMMDEIQILGERATTSGVPEPATAGLLILAGASLIRRRRRA